jgi:hypothetical protein
MNAKKLTRNQHFVPRMLMRHWATPESAHQENFSVMRFDLKLKAGKAIPVNSFCSEDWLYEHSDLTRDNEIENKLATLETNWSRVLRELSADISSGSKITISNSRLRNLVDLACIQMLRTPTARETLAVQKMLGPKSFNFADIFSILPELAFTLKNSTQAVLQIAREGCFFSSDNPCFEVADSQLEPEFVREIGVNPDVVWTFPILPRACLCFAHRELVPGLKFSKVPPVVVHVDQPTVDNQNALTVQKAERFVICSRAEDFSLICDEAKNRPKVALQGY